MRQLVAITLGLALLAASAPAARASGSSTVKSASRYFVVGVESVRKIFEGGANDREAQWHQEWQKEHQRDVNKLKRALATVLETPEQLELLALIPYDEKLPELRDGEFDDDLDATKKAFRCVYREGMARLTVAYKKRPTNAQQKALRKLLAATVKRVLGDR